MPLHADHIRAIQFPTSRAVVTDRDAMLYALSIGLGRDPMDRHDLQYVYEDKLKVFPTLPLIIGHPGNWMVDPATGITRTMVVHGAQRLWLHAPLRIDTPLTTDNHVVDVLDKGEKGAVMVIERNTREEGGKLVARSESHVFCRADGGFGGQPGPAYDFQPVPDRTPDHVVEMPTEPNAALLYRLNQDRNPLHADPDVAAKAGFSQPILHGLATFGLAAVAVAKLWPDRELNMVETRFSKPVLPGETVSVDIWEEADGVAFRARVAARNAVVLDRGRAAFA